MTAPDSLDGTDPLLRGVGLDAQTRCAHYATARDVVALRFACCPAYWSCHRCHAELTDHPAVTLHRLLQAQGFGGGFARNEEWPLDADVVVVDEASMLDVELTEGDR